MDIKYWDAEDYTYYENLPNSDGCFKNIPSNEFFGSFLSVVISFTDED